jgi:hypothetical protein
MRLLLVSAPRSPWQNGYVERVILKETAIK